MRDLMKCAALTALVLAPALTSLGCNTACVNGYYGSYCYSYGYYYDSLVSGLNYETTGDAGLQGGVTGADSEGGPGSFRYVEGDRITFSLGDTVLGASDAGDRLTPFDLAGLEEDAIGGCEVDATLPQDDGAFRLVSNLAVLLQTLDADGDPENGIDISADVEALFAGVELDLAQDPEQFREDAKLLALLASAGDGNILPAGRTPRDRREALRALYRGIALCP